MLTDFDELSFKVLNARKSGHVPGRFKVAPRSYAALSLRLDGAGVFLVKGKELVSRRGDVLYIPAETPYEVEYSVGSTNEIAVVHLINCNYTEPELLHASENHAVKTLFLDLIDSWESGCSPNRTKAYIYSLLDLLEEARHSVSRGDAMHRFTDFFEENFNDPNFNIDEVCKKFYISRSTLQRLFLNNFGLSPWQYLIKLRMRHALRLLSDGHIRVADAAHESGFSDVKYFSVVFRKNYGFSPSNLKGGSGI